ncbi:MAG: DUF362 domain-containing protein [Planctomycetaceae bacterium]|nr:DUF362 domain-containing protein [Planctomycetaceae bacterium]
MRTPDDIKPDVFIARCRPAYDAVCGQDDGAVRRALRDIWTAMGVDPDDPFGGLLTPGGFAVIKPNWVLHRNAAGHGLDCLVTHSCLVYYIADWCAKAMKGRGRIVIGDAPVQGCNFDALMQRTGMSDVAAALRTAYPHIDLSLADWRLTLWEDGEAAGSSPCGCGRHKSRATRETVKEHYSELDCGAASFLEEVSDCADRFRVTMYRPSLMQSHHRPGVHQYLIRNDVLDADLLINLPKMKTHKKAGLTGALKNLVGVNGHKEYLPHHIIGPYCRGGDAYCRNNRFHQWAEQAYDYWWENEQELGGLRKWLVQKAYTALARAGRLTGGGNIDHGNWSGNDTVWRTALDLNHLVYFGERRPKRVLSVIDGIVAGEGDGPLRPTPKRAGVILVGENPAYVDAAIGRLMGYNVARIPIVHHAVYDRRSKFAGPCLEAAPVCVTGETPPQRLASSALESLAFVPPEHWERCAIASIPSDTNG